MCPGGDPFVGSGVGAANEKKARPLKAVGPLSLLL